MPEFWTICKTMLWKNTYQYGEPMKDFLLANVAVIWADTPKSAKTHTNF